MTIVRHRFTQPARWTWGQFTNGAGATIRTGSLAVPAAPRGNIVVLTGLSEYAEKYFETARLFSRLGYNIYTMDWRGQGGSDRYLSDRFKRHSLGYEHDRDDLVRFVEHLVPDNAPKFFLTHSMGALPVMLALRDNPRLVRGAMMVAPLLGFLHPLARGREKLLASLPLPRTLSESYIPKGGPWRPRTLKDTGNRPADFTSCPERMFLHDRPMTDNPALRVGDPTIGWVHHTARAMLAVRAPSVPESLGDMPFLIATAGQEKIVSNAATFNMVARLPDVRHVHIPGAGHEILMETPALRLPLIRQMAGFLDFHR